MLRVLTVLSVGLLLPNSKCLVPMQCVKYRECKTPRLGFATETNIEKYPGVRVLDYRKILNDNAAEAIAEFRELETLIAGQSMLTNTGAQHLATLSRLKSISCVQGSEEDAERLKTALPQCEIDFR